MKGRKRAICWFTLQRLTIVSAGPGKLAAWNSIQASPMGSGAQVISSRWQQAEVGSRAKSQPHAGLWTLSPELKLSHHKAITSVFLEFNFQSLGTGLLWVQGDFNACYKKLHIDFKNVLYQNNLLIPSSRAFRSSSHNWSYTLFAFCDWRISVFSRVICNVLWIELTNCSPRKLYQFCISTIIAWRRNPPS